MDFKNMLTNATNLCDFPDGPLTAENMEYVRGIAELLADCSGDTYGEADHYDVKESLMWGLSKGRMGTRPEITAQHVMENVSYYSRAGVPCLMYAGRYRVWFLMFGDTKDSMGPRYTAVAHPIPSQDTEAGAIEGGNFQSVWHSAQAVAIAENADDGSHDSK